MRNFYDKLLQELALQPYRHLDIDGHILATFARMMDCLLEDAPKLPRGSFVELGYDRLVADPLGALDEIYRQLDLDGFTTAQPRFAAYLESVQGYRTNRYGFSEESARLVERHWSRFIDHWTYNRPKALLGETRSAATAGQ